MKIFSECPLGGDTANNCADCVYSTDFQFDHETGDCIKRKEYEPEFERFLEDKINKHENGGCDCKEDTMELCLGGNYVNGNLTKEEIYEDYWRG